MVLQHKYLQVWPKPANKKSTSSLDRKLIFRIHQLLSNILQALLAVYLVAVVLLVRRQIYQGEEEVDEEEEEERVLMTDKRGKTDIRLTEEVVSDNKEVLM